MKKATLKKLTVTRDAPRNLTAEEIKLIQGGDDQSPPAGTDVRAHIIADG